ncbi:MAG: prolyl oligopeptidase family serine peptidase, partial [Blastocatellia bacterium]
SNDMRDWYCRGYTPIGIEVWNAMRAVDYLLTRSDVDGKKLTINGVSGGGHLSWMTGAVDDRLAVVQPVAGTADVQAHVQLDLQARHCDCAYFINTYRHDWTTLAALIAPRPLLLHNSSEDPYYPPEGYQRVFKRVQSLYGLSGAAEKAGIFEAPGGHDYTQAEREKAVEWSEWWLRGERAKITERPFEKIPGAQLSAFGGDLPKDAINHKIQELLIPTAAPKSYRSLPRWEKARAEITEKLKTVVFRNMPRPHAGIKKMDWGNGRMALETEDGVLVGMTAVPDSSPEAGKKQPAIVYVASPGETEDSIVWNFMRAGSFRRLPATRYVVFPRGVGTRIWDDTIRRRIERSAMLIGRTLDEMRLYDVLCAVNYAASQPSFDGRELTVVGKGVSGALGAYAALLDQRITRVILHSPPLTHQTGPSFLNILRYTDLPQTLACLAPRELVFLGHEIDAFDYTRSIYRLYRAEDRFRRGYTVSQILNRKEVPQ